MSVTWGDFEYEVQLRNLNSTIGGGNLNDNCGRRQGFLFANVNSRPVYLVLGAESWESAAKLKCKKKWKSRLRLSRQREMPPATGQLSGVGTDDREAAAQPRLRSPMPPIPQRLSPRSDARSQIP
jgi:hypothetical protein